MVAGLVPVHSDVLVVGQQSVQVLLGGVLWLGVVEYALQQWANLAKTHGQHNNERETYRCFTAFNLIKFNK